MIVRPIRTAPAGQCQDLARYNEHGSRVEEKANRKKYGENYIPKGKIVFQNLINSFDYVSISNEMSVSMSEYYGNNPSSQLKKPLFSGIISFDKSDVLRDEEIEAILSGYAEHMGFENHQYVVWEHTDKEHRHFHILMNRIDNDNQKIWNDSYSEKRGVEYAKICEELYPQLKKVKRPEKKNIDEFKANQTTTNSFIKTIRSKIESALVQTTSLDEFKVNLLKNNISIKSGFGMVFIDETTGKKIGQKELGKSFSRNAILELLQNNLKQLSKDSRNQNLEEISTDNSPAADESLMREILTIALENSLSYEMFVFNLAQQDVAIEDSGNYGLQYAYKGKKFHANTINSKFLKKNLVVHFKNKIHQKVSRKATVKTPKDVATIKAVINGALHSSNTLRDFYFQLSEAGFGLNKKNKHLFYDKQGNVYTLSDLGEQYHIDRIKNYIDQRKQFFKTPAIKTLTKEQNNFRLILKNAISNASGYSDIDSNLKAMGYDKFKKGYQDINGNYFSTFMYKDLLNKSFLYPHFEFNKHLKGVKQKKARFNTLPLNLKQIEAFQRVIFPSLDTLTDYDFLNRTKLTKALLEAVNASQQTYHFYTNYNKIYIIENATGKTSILPEPLTPGTFYEQYKQQRPSKLKDTNDNFIKLLNSSRTYTELFKKLNDSPYLLNFKYYPTRYELFLKNDISNPTLRIPNSYISELAIENYFKSNMEQLLTQILASQGSLSTKLSKCKELGLKLYFDKTENKFVIKDNHLKLILNPEQQKQVSALYQKEKPIYLFDFFDFSMANSGGVSAQDDTTPSAGRKPFKSEKEEEAERKRRKR